MPIKLLFTLALALIITIQAFPAFAATTRTTTFHLSVTIPEHVMMPSGNDPVGGAAYQLVQKQILIRNNRAVSMTSIVVP